MEAHGARQILTAVRMALSGRERVVLAVSGGLDSMVLLDAVQRAEAAGQVIVATFDHGTGSAARKAVRLVQSEAQRRGIHVRAGRAELPGASEAQWREARWRFLREVAAAEGASVVTGHTRDDQIETVVMRVLRGSGVRGLAGLFAASEIVRPLLDVSRSAIAGYANRYRVPFVEDPSNSSLAYLRNRVRRELLPAIRALNPSFEHELLDLAREAAQVRQELDERAREMLLERPKRGFARLESAPLEHLDEPSRRLLWQSIAHLAGFPLDWRGTVRAARFTRTARPGQSMQLAGGAEIVRETHTYVLRPLAHSNSGVATVPLKHQLSFGEWHFRRLEPGQIPEEATTPWVAAVPASEPLSVRSWQPGDRLVLPSKRANSATGNVSRRVARFFSDAGVAGPLRRGWPVVLSAGKVIWIPGIRSSLDESCIAPGIVLYSCEHRTG